MPNTVPNQRTVNIHREETKSNFLGIKNENWMAASRNLGATALRLYLYLAANRDGYVLALSPAAIERDLGMARSTYHDQFRKLVNEGYLINTHGNTYDFYEVPQPRAVTDERECTAYAVEVNKSYANAVDPCLNIVYSNPQFTTEINTIDIIDKNIINNGLETEESYDWSNSRKEFVF